MMLMMAMAFMGGIWRADETVDSSERERRVSVLLERTKAMVPEAVGLLREAAPEWLED